MPKTLLLADDSVTIQRVVELTFAHEDIRVVTVSDGAKAVEAIKEKRPDIVVVDVAVPSVDGYAIVQHVKKSPALRHIPVLLLAGAFEPVDEGRARSSGSDGVLVKPFEPKHLVARVKELLVESERWAPVAKPEPVAVAAANVRTAPVEVPGRGSVGVVDAARGGKREKLETAPMSKAKSDTHEDFEGDPTSAAPEPLELPTSSIWGTAAGSGPISPAGGAPAKVSLATAFSELLAAEQARPSQAAGPTAPAQVSDAAIEEAVKRVLARMTESTVRQIVLDTAERLIREEIEKIKANPE
jgi:DNA-binding response OmpR family regulator